MIVLQFRTLNQQFSLYRIYNSTTGNVKGFLTFTGKMVSFFFIFSTLSHIHERSMLFCTELNSSTTATSSSLRYSQQISL